MLWLETGSAVSAYKEENALRINTEGLVVTKCNDFSDVGFLLPGLIGVVLTPVYKEES